MKKLGLRKELKPGKLLFSLSLKTDFFFPCMTKGNFLSIFLSLHLTDPDTPKRTTFQFKIQFPREGTLFV